MLSHYVFNLHLICISLRDSLAEATDLEDAGNTAAMREASKSRNRNEIAYSSPHTIQYSIRACIGKSFQKVGD